MLIERTKPAIAAAFATGNIVSGLRRIAQRAANQRPAVNVSVTMIAAAIIGQSGSRNATRSAALDTERSSVKSSQNLVANVCDAGRTIRACLRSTTSTGRRSYVRRIVSIRHRFASSYGRRKWAISKCYAPTATASRLGKIDSADIACRRIEEAYRQPRLFAEPKPAPKQEALL